MRNIKNSFNKLSKKQNRGKGFTLAELLIVVAIIGILVAISIPIFTMQLHKARVATDWANLRSYYSEIQADFISTGKYNPKVKADNYEFTELNEIDFLNGQKVKLKAGVCYIREESTGKGYQILYYCNKYWPGLDQKHYDTCTLALGIKG